MINENSVPQMEEIKKEKSEPLFFDALTKIGATIQSDTYKVEGAYRIQFTFGDNVVTTFRVLLKDQSGDDLVIANMTTLPEDMTGQGFGGTALFQLIRSAKENGFNTIRAVQIQKHVESFWIKNGFVSDPEALATNDFVYTAK